jgi:AcrR family transcriptional regulator
VQQKENRRIRMTKTMLKDSLIELMQKLPINKITIKEICNNADINRSTFYVYYTDQYALLSEIEDEIISKAKEYMQKMDSGMNELELLEGFLNYIAENISLFRILLCEQWDYAFQKRFMDIVMKEFMEKKKKVNGWNEDMSQYISTFVVMGSMSLIQNWINNSLNKSSKALAEMLLLLVDKGLSAYE